MSLKSKIESLLFVANKPLAATQLAKMLSTKVGEIKKATEDLLEDYKTSDRGLKIVKSNDKYQMTSAPENFAEVKNLIQEEITGDLSRPSLEALTVVAYRGPISKAELDQIRGVNCALIIRNLLVRGLIESQFDKKKQETYYNITCDFLKFLGINDVKELPEYEKFNTAEAIDEILAQPKD